MSTAIIVAVLIVIAVIAIRSYAKKRLRGVAAVKAEHVKKIKVEDKDVSHYPYCVQIGIDRNELQSLQSESRKYT